MLFKKICILTYLFKIDTMRIIKTLALVLYIFVISCNENKEAIIKAEDSSISDKEMIEVLGKIEKSSQLFQQKLNELKSNNDSLYKLAKPKYDDFIKRSAILMNKQNELLKRQTELKQQLKDKSLEAYELDSNQSIINKDFQILKNEFDYLMKNYENLQYNMNSRHAEEFSFEET